MTDVILFTSANSPLRSMGVAKLATLLRDKGGYMDCIQNNYIIKKKNYLGI